MHTKRLIYLIFAFMPLLITILLLPSLPDRIPMHFDLAGNIDRYGSRYETFIIPILSACISFLLMIAGRIVMRDKEKGPQNVKFLFWCSNSCNDLVFTYSI